MNENPFDAQPDTPLGACLTTTTAKQMKSIFILLTALTCGLVTPFTVPAVGRTAAVQTGHSHYLLLAHPAKSNIDKNVYKPNKVDGNYDTIVIGSGIGGLCTASLLAQHGQKVLVLEQHYVAGGACHTFPSKGFRFATGIHYVGCMKDGELHKKLLDSLVPLDDPVVWDRMDDHFETVVLGDSSYKMYTGEEKLKQSLKQSFPKDKKAIDEYYNLVKKARASEKRVLLFKALPLTLARFLTLTGLHRWLDAGFRKWSKMTVQEGLEHITSNKELQAVLAYNWGDYGVEPSRAPFVMQLLCAAHFLEGAYYPHGGPSVIPRKIIPKINNCGGKVLVSAPVKRILIDEDKKKKVVGVEMADGTVIHSKSVVSDAGFINTFTKLLPPGLIELDLAKTNNASFGKLHPGSSALAMFVGLKGDSEKLNLPKSQYWIYSSNDVSESVKKLKSSSLQEALKMKPHDMSPIFVGNPCSKDKAWTKDHPNKSALEIFLVVTPWQWFETFQEFFDKKTRSHGPEYESVKRILAEKVWERVVEVLGKAGAKLPKTLEEVDLVEIGTPLTFAHYYKSEKGAFYGLDHSLERFDPKTFYLRLRPEVPEVSGLYLSGQDVTAVSFAASMASGWLCAQKVLGVKNPLSLLRDTKKNKGDHQQEVPTTNVGMT